MTNETPNLYRVFSPEGGHLMTAPMAILKTVLGMSTAAAHRVKLEVEVNKIASVHLTKGPLKAAWPRVVIQLDSIDLVRRAMDRIEQHDEKAGNTRDLDVAYEHLQDVLDSRALLPTITR